MARQVGQPTATGSHVSAWRRAAVVLLVIVGVAGAAGYTVIHWFEHRVLTTDNWVALVGPLPEQPVVATALGSYIADQVFMTAPAAQTIAGALPPQAAFLADPLADQLHTKVTQAAQRLVAGDAFQALWVGANRIAMNRLVTVARGQTPPLQARIEQRFNIDLSDVVGRLRQTLGSAADALPAGKQALNLSTNLHVRADRLHQIIRTTDFMAAVLPLGVATCLLWAFALAPDRRRMLLVTVGLLALCLLLELITIRLLRQQVLAQVHNAAYVSAVGYVFDTLLEGLKGMILWLLVGLAVLFGLGLLAGPAIWAQALRSYIRLDRLQRGSAVRWWHEVRRWIHGKRVYLWLAVVGAVLVGLAAYVSVTTASLINATLLIASLVALVEWLATPRLPAQRGESYGE